MECLDFSAVMPTEEEQGVRVRIKQVCVTYYRHEPVKALAHVCSSGDQVDFVDTGNIA